jgi:hypothetical protein
MSVNHRRRAGCPACLGTRTACRPDMVHHRFSYFRISSRQVGPFPGTTNDDLTALKNGHLTELVLNDVPNDYTC